MTVENNYDVGRGYAAFSAGDTDTLTELFAPDIVHRYRDRRRCRVTTRGRRTCWRCTASWPSCRSVHVSSKYCPMAQHVIYRANAERNGQMGEALLFTIVDGKVTEIQDFFGDIEAADSG